jgi:aspartate carbamoyltransferase catalytic subunit
LVNLSVNAFRNRDVVSVKDFSRDELDALFKTASDVEANPGDYRDVFPDKRVALLFSEPSTRTYGSFEASATNLGCKILSNRDPAATSFAKGETLHDTIKMIESYDTDCIVMRDKRWGSSRYAAEVSELPVISGGSGSREHPTQAMLDLYTILKRRGRLDGVRLAFVGDLRYGRTCSSLSYGLGKYDGVELIFVAPPILQVRREVEIHLQQVGVPYTKTPNLSEAVEDVDVLYVTRVQKERFPDPTDFERIRGSYVVDMELVRRGKPGLGVMHPLPRVDELSPEIDRTEHCWYFEQAANGIPIRTALLYLVLGD